MKLIYTNENSFLVSNIKNIVENKGINVFLKNEFAAAGGSGDLAPLETWVELWVVDDDDYDRAMAVIENFKAQESRDWTCSSCSEENAGSFEYCWNCQENCPTTGIE